MNRRVVIGVVVVAALLGGGYFVQTHLESRRRSAALERLVAEARAELEQDPPRREDVRRVARELAQALDEHPGEPRLLVLRARLLRQLGDPRRAFEVVAMPAVTPGAAPQVVGVAGELLGEVAALTGDADEARRARAFAREHYQATGDPESLRRAWLLAFRGGDRAAFAELGRELLERGDGTAERVVRVLGRELAEFLRARDGVPLDAAEGPLAQLLDESGAPPSIRELDELQRTLGESAPPEIWVLRAARRVSSVGEQRDEAARAELFAALEDVDAVLERQPASLEARHVGVVAYVGLWQAEALVEEDFRRFRGYLDWLLRNAPETHAWRRQWRAIRDRLGD